MFVLLAFAVASCEKPSPEPTTDIELIPEAGYIRFSTGVATKSPLIENLRGKNFGVFGYQYGYSTKWEVARPTARPEVFHNLTVSCAETNGNCSYDLDPSQPENQLKPWELSQKYSFFAYYPMVADGNGISVSRSNDVNMPTVTYNLPLKSGKENEEDEDYDEVDPDEIQDLMTAYAIDKTAYDGFVGFTFQHRLFCVEVLAQNFNKDMIETIDGQQITLEADEVISDVSLTIENLAYQSITVPMVKDDSAPVKVANSYGPVTFRIMGPDKSITIPSQEGGNATPISLSRVKESEESENYDENFVMLVPQDATVTPMTGYLTFRLNGSTELITRTFTTDLNFQEGKKYTVVLSFTGKTVLIAIAEAGSWEPNSVPYEFE